MDRRVVQRAITGLGVAIVGVSLGPSALAVAADQSTHRRPLLRRRKEDSGM
jgi:hypothetical protein